MIGNTGPIFFSTMQGVRKHRHRANTQVRRQLTTWVDRGKTVQNGTHPLLWHQTTDKDVLATVRLNTCVCILCVFVPLLQVGTC